MALLLVEDEEEDCSISSWLRFLDITLLEEEEDCSMSSWSRFLDITLLVEEEEEEEDCSMSSWLCLLDIALLLLEDEECFLDIRFFQWYALQCDTDGTVEARCGSTEGSTEGDKP